MAATHGYFPLVGVGTLHGRSFTAADDAPGAAPVVVLGERFWRARFNGDPSIIGTTIRLDDAPRQVIGIVPAGADFGLDQIHARAAYHGAYRRGRRRRLIPLPARRNIRATRPSSWWGACRSASLAMASDELRSPLGSRAYCSNPGAASSSSR
jgi:hypothetical protein